MQLGVILLKGSDFTLAHQPVDAANAQAIAHGDLLDGLHVRQAATVQAHLVLIDKVAVFQQQQVHAAGLSCSSSCSPRGRARTKRLNTIPTSYSSHMGNASRVWEITSGGVNTMPMAKQPTTT